MQVRVYWNGKQEDEAPEFIELAAVPRKGERIIRSDGGDVHRWGD